MPNSGPTVLTNIRVDLQLVADLVENNSRVLDIGCDDGQLLYHLVHEKQVDGRGIEISHAGVSACAKKGLSVIQGDAETDLSDYPSGIFDYVILSQTLQAVREPRFVLEQLMRIGRYAIVSFPNFGHWRIRAHFALKGVLPNTVTLPHPWYETPNFHLCTIRDFFKLCEIMDLKIEKMIAVNAQGQALYSPTLRWANLIGEQAVFLLSPQVCSTPK